MADLGYRALYTMSRIEVRLPLVTTHHLTGSIRQTAPHACGWLPSLDAYRLQPPCSAAG